MEKGTPLAVRSDVASKAQGVEGERRRFLRRMIGVLGGVLVLLACFLFLTMPSALAASPEETVAALCRDYLQSGLAVMTTGDADILGRTLSAAEQERISGRFLGPSGLCWLWRYYQEDWRSGWKTQPTLSQTFSPPVVVFQGEEALCYLREELRVSALGLRSGKEVETVVSIPHALRLRQGEGGWAITADLTVEENVPSAPGLLSDGSSLFPRVEGFPNYEEAIAVVASPSLLEPQTRPFTPSRGAVVAYADQYALTPNTPYYPDFSSGGGDCANYVSQCLYEGGWAMDSSSPVERQWWFHWPGNWADPLNSSDSWRFAGDYPDGGGLANVIEWNPAGSSAPNGANPGRADAHWQELKLGDVVLVQKDDGGHHAAVVAAFDADHGGPAPYPLVDAHSANRYHYPLDWNGAYRLEQIDVLLLRYPQPTAQTLVCTPTSFALQEMEGEKGLTSQPLFLSDSSGGTLHWSIQCDAPWLTFPASGVISHGSQGGGSVCASADTLLPGTYSATLTVQAPEAVNSPVYLPVSLVVTPATFMNLLIQQGWNQISLPIQTPTSPAQVFGHLEEPWYLYQWDPVQARYRSRGEVSLQPGVGYWLKPAVSQYPIAMSITGTPLREAEKAVDLTPGWNMVGLPYLQPVGWDRVQVRTASACLTLGEAASAKILALPFYWWDGSVYQAITAESGTFQKGEGYWIRARLPCQLVFPGPPPLSP